MKRKVLQLVMACSLLVSIVPLLRAQNTADLLNENTIVVPEGTEFKLDLHTSINSKTSRVGDRVLTTLVEPVVVEDENVLPKGVRVDGHIREVKKAGHRGKGGNLTITFDTLQLPNGQRIAIIGSLTEVFSTVGGGNPLVGIEGDLKGRGASRKVQAGIVGGAVAAGVAGGTGTAIASGVGGLLAAWLIPKGKQAKLLAGSLIGMRLDRDLTLPLPANAQ